MKKYILITAIVLLLTGCNSLEKQETNSEKNILDVSESTQEEIDHTPLESQINNSQLSSVLDIDNNASFEEYLPILMFHYIEDVPSDSPDQLRYGLSFAPESLE